MNELESIGWIAVQTDVTVATVRYYDEVGLIETAGRVGGKRRFTRDTVGRINFIRRAQASGFDLSEIKRILDDSDRSWPQLVDAKLAELETRRAELEEMIAMLAAIRDCGCEAVAKCPRIDEPWVASQPEA